MQCAWLIQTGSAVTLTFSAFGTEAGYDFVKVFAGSTTSSPLLGSFSGTSTPAAVTSSTGTMLVTFSSDSSVGATGFIASYSSSSSSGGGGSGGGAGGVGAGSSSATVGSTPYPTAGASAPTATPPITPPSVSGSSGLASA